MMVRRIDSVNFASSDLDGFSSIFDDILTTATLTAEDIVMEGKNQQNSAPDEKNLQEEDFEEQEIEVNVPTINEALQAIRVVHYFYEATSENVQVICDLQGECTMTEFPIFKNLVKLKFPHVVKKSKYSTVKLSYSAIKGTRGIVLL